MGLGKTAQVIAFLANIVGQGDQARHLIIVPSSTLSNWMRELERWCPDLAAFSYSGTLEQRRETQDDILDGDQRCNVMVTTYNIATGSKEDRAFLKHLKCKSMILDEGHMMKNASSQRYRHLMAYKTPFRLLLTGCLILIFRHSVTE